MRYQFYGSGSFPLRASVAWILIAVTCQLSALTQAQSQGRDNNRQLVQPESSALEGHKERRVALVIGNSAYRNASRLTNPVNDARDMAEALRSLGFKVLLKEDLTSDPMRAAVMQFGDMLRNGGGVGLFYYAGHGIQVNGRNYLIPVEADVLREERIEFDAVDVNRVLAEMETAGNGLNMVILDACRTNPFMRSWRAAEGGLAQIKAPTGTFIAYATSPDAVASDGVGRNGLFTAELLRQMRVPGITIEQIIKRVRRTIKAQTGGKQVPWEASTLDGDFYFTSPAVDSITVENEFWRSVKDSQNPEDIKDYLKEYPNGIYSSLARNSLRKLEDKTRKTKAAINITGGYPSETQPAVSAERRKQAAALVVSGDAHRMNGAFDNAIREITEAIRIDPNNALAYALRGSAYQGKGVGDLAILDFTQSIRIDPNFTWAYSQRCLAYLAKGAQELALSDINEVIRLEPKNYWAYKTRSTVYHNLGLHDAAQADEQREMNDLTEAILKTPQDSDRFTDRCHAFRVRLQLDLAFADCNEAIRLNPKSAIAYAARGDVYNLKGLYNQAAIDLTEAIRLSPSFYWPYERRAEVYRKVGLYSLANEDEKKAAALKVNR